MKAQEVGNEHRGDHFSFPVTQALRSWFVELEKTLSGRCSGRFPGDSTSVLLGCKGCYPNSTEEGSLGKKEAIEGIEGSLESDPGSTTY